MKAIIIAAALILAGALPALEVYGVIAWPAWLVWAPAGIVAIVALFMAGLLGMALWHGDDLDWPSNEL